MLYYLSPLASQLATAALYAGGGIPEARLPELLTGQPSDLPLLGIERLLGPLDVEVPETERGVTHVELRQAYEGLARLENGNSPQASSRSHYLTRLRDRLHEPTRGAILSHIRSALPLKPDEEKILQKLSCMAQEGLYLLTLSLPLPERELRQFLRRGRNKGLFSLIDEVLRLVALLYDRGVEGYEAGFYKTAFDRKFLSVDFRRLNSLRTEYQEALRLAWNSDATEVILSPRLPIDWHSLTDPEHAFIVREILPRLHDDLKTKFAGQTSVEVDFLVGRNGKGRRRVVEVKTARNGSFSPEASVEAEMLLQVFRHALLARQNGLEGVEYVIVAKDVDPGFLKKLRLALEITRTPYLIRLESPGSRRLFSHNLNYPFLDRPIPEIRRRPLPKIPGSRQAA